MKKVIFFILITSIFAQARENLKISQHTSNDTLYTFATDTLNSSQENVWKAITDFENIDKFMPSVKKCTIIKKGDNYVVTHMEISAVITTVKYYVKNSLIKKSEIFRWEDYKIAGKDDPFYYNNGGWNLKKISPNKTLATYWISLKYKTSIPKWIERKLIKGTIPDLFDSVEKRANSY